MGLFSNYPKKHKVIVNTKNDKSFRGILYKKNPNYLVLTKSELLLGVGETTPIDGELFIYKSDVDFIQVVS